MKITTTEIIIRLIIAIAICQLAGVVGAVFTTPNIPTWYNTLNKPLFTPSGSFIGIVWILLYTLMGISLFFIWNKRAETKEKKKIKEIDGVIKIFAAQLVLNAAWSFLFFGLRSLLYGLVGIGALWVVVIYTVYKVYNISPIAAAFLIPYILWVTFAGYLNFLLWKMN